MRLGPLLNVEKKCMWIEFEICSKKGQFFTLKKVFNFIIDDAQLKHGHTYRCTMLVITMHLATLSNI